MANLVYNQERVTPIHGPAELLGRTTWQFIPFDDHGYLNSQDVLAWSDDKLKEFVQIFEAHRYKGHRNWNNLWRDKLGLDSTHGKTVCDFGCGFGIEALQFCKSGNQVHLKDIYLSNVQVAERILRLCGYEPYPSPKVDVFYSNGVLHHTPKIREILQEAVTNLNPGGEVRLMLYSDRAWVGKTGAMLPEIILDISQHSSFATFVKAMDSSGTYADWYNQEKLDMRVGDFLEIQSFDYIMQDKHFAVAILKPR